MQGPGLAPRVPNPLRALVAQQNASGAPLVAHWALGPLGTGRHRLCTAGAPGLAGSGCPIPCAHSPFHVTPRALLAHWESHLPADPLVGSIGLLDGRCSCCVQWRCRGTLGRAGGDHGWVGGDLGAPGWVAGIGMGCGLGGPCCPFPPHSWSTPGGLRLLLRKQPIWAAIRQNRGGQDQGRRRGHSAAQ